MLSVQCCFSQKSLLKYVSSVEMFFLEKSWMMYDEFIYHMFSMLQNLSFWKLHDLAPQSLPGDSVETCFKPRWTPSQVRTGLFFLVNRWWGVPGKCPTSVFWRNIARLSSGLSDLERLSQNSLPRSGFFWSFLLQMLGRLCTYIYIYIYIHILFI